MGWVYDDAQDLFEFWRGGEVVRTVSWNVWQRRREEIERECQDVHEVSAV